MVTQVNASYAELHTWENLYRANRKATKGNVAAPQRPRSNTAWKTISSACRNIPPPRPINLPPYANFTIHETKRRHIGAARFCVRRKWNQAAAIVADGPQATALKAI